MELSKVLYNDSCGDWSFSDEFFSEGFLNIYKEKYGKELNLCNDSYRYDPTVIQLYEELGEKPSSYIGASIKIYEFPTRWLNCMDIRTFEGREIITFSKDKAYKHLLSELIITRSVTDDDIEKYNQIEEVYKVWGVFKFKPNPKPYKL